MLRASRGKLESPMWHITRRSVICTTTAGQRTKLGEFCASVFPRGAIEGFFHRTPVIVGPAISLNRTPEYRNVSEEPRAQCNSLERFDPRWKSGICRRDILGIRRFKPAPQNRENAHNAVARKRNRISEGDATSLLRDPTHQGRKNCSPDDCHYD